MTDAADTYQAEAAAAASLPTVQDAWAAVMRDVQGLGKGQRNKAQGFNFRGVDDVMNAVGPVLRQHGVAVVPADVDLRTRDAQTTGGKPAHETTVVVRYTIFGPAGDSMPGASAGESLDSGDKATPKAMSVAYRTFLLQALCLPTDEPDPDGQSYQREQQQETPEQAARRGIANAPTVQALDQVMAWAQQQGVADLVRQAATTRKTELEGASA